MSFLRRGYRSVSGRARNYFCSLRSIYVSAIDENIIFGRNVKIFPRAIVRTFDGGIVQFGSDVKVKYGAVIEAKFGKINIGSNTEIGVGSIVVCKKSISIGAGVLIAEYVTIRDQDHIFPDSAIIASGFEKSDIVIGDNVWIGAKATVTKKVRIGANSVVAAGAVVTRDIPENCLVAGVPARLIKSWG